MDGRGQNGVRAYSTHLYMTELRTSQVGFLLTLKGAADQECHLDHFEGPGASWIMPLGSTGDKLNFWGNVTKDVSS